jgi:hypothetical protein
MVTVVLLGLPLAAFNGPDSPTEKVLLPIILGDAGRLIVKLLSVVSPGAQAKVPLDAV